mmetsp:Transcript_62835/g.175089  ORF Transcript_62835/g.175089 Transcript_62835/m.175089 type:complete len:107 (-) Transcript_62835:28-348(-)
MAPAELGKPQSEAANNCEPRRMQKKTRQRRPVLAMRWKLRKAPGNRPSVPLMFVMFMVRLAAFRRKVSSMPCMSHLKVLNLTELGRHEQIEVAYKCKLRRLQGLCW